MEIDLGELELYEKKLNEKRQRNCDQPTTNVMATEQTSSQHNDKTRKCDIDELDEYLDRLSIEINEREQRVNNATHITPVPATTSVTISPSTTTVCSSQQVHTTNSSQLNFYTNHITSQNNGNGTDDGKKKCNIFDNSHTSLPMLLYTLMGILVFINCVHCKNLLKSKKKNRSKIFFYY